MSKTQLNIELIQDFCQKFKWYFKNVKNPFENLIEPKFAHRTPLTKSYKNMLISKYWTKFWVWNTLFVRFLTHKKVNIKKMNSSNHGIYQNLHILLNFVFTKHCWFYLKVLLCPEIRLPSVIYLIDKASKLSFIDK